MGLKAPKTSEFKAQEPLEAGTYAARVVQVIDLGLQAQMAWQGQQKPPAPMISITYELCDEFMKDENGEDMEDKPRWISEMFALRSLSSDRAKSTERYKVFDPNNLFGGDFSKCLNSPVMVTVVNNKKGDRVYNNVGTVSAMREKEAKKCPELVNKAVFFDLDNPDIEVFNSLPSFVKEKIKANLEYNGSALQKLLGNTEQTQEVKSEVNYEESEENSPY